MISHLAWVGFALGGIWFVWLLRRLQIAWDTGQGRVMKFGQDLRQAERELADEQKRFEQLGNRIKHAQSQLEKTRKDEQEMRQKIASSGAPPTLEILVASEFASSGQETPWVANMMARSTINADAAPKSVLFWASDYPMAVMKAKRLAEEMQCAVNDIRRFAKGGG